MNPVIVDERNQEYKGRNYAFISNRYYGNGEVRLHRLVYEDHFGPIPDGYHVHHKDHNRHNNSIENLELMNASEHLRHHMSLRPKQEVPEAARIAAAKWHGSEEGRKWHKEQYDKYGHTLYKTGQFTCKHCGIEYKAVISVTHGNDYCSKKCKAAARRKSGVDDEVRVCKCCSKEFTINKYSKTEVCGRSCSLKLRHKDRKENAIPQVKACFHCGAEFETIDKRKNFCSQSCYQKNYNQKKKSI